MNYAILKITYIKLPPTKVVYRDCKNWPQLQFEERNLESFFVKALEAKAPTKTKIFRANNKPHAAKEL